MESATASSVERFRICFRPSPDLMVSGTNPLTLLNELRALGECEVKADLAAVPLLETLQADRCHIAWEVILTTDKGLNAIKDVFMFVEDGSDLQIGKADASAETAEKPVTAAASPARPTMLNPAELGSAEQGGGVPSPKVQATAIAEQVVRRTVSKESMVRVPSERLDRLVNLVGELVMNQSRLSQVSASVNVANLSAPVEELERLVDELRDNVLSIRMMPIGTTFSRFKRLVHDLSEELGKEIELVLEGAETELDKTVIDQLGDPLVHLIRNSIDHGIEAPESRVRAGKPRRGTLRLAAAHVGSNVIITISDDGRGIDTEAIRAKAIEKGLIAAEAKLSQRETYDLIFRPGFSTAKEVTSVSGRGVGMDVVKRQFEALRGQVAISSDPGTGTTVTLTLPLTLAIIDGLLVEVAGDQFIVPMAVVTENVELPRAERSRNNGRNIVSVRGELVPYVRLRETFSINTPDLDIEKIVIARHGDDRVGVVVDRVLGSHQTVIQPLGRFYRGIELISGATIMGNGRVALILDLGGLVRVANEQCSRVEPARRQHSFRQAGRSPAGGDIVSVGKPSSSLN